MRFADARKGSKKATLFAPCRLSGLKLFDALRILSSDAHVIRRPRRPGDSNVKIQRLGAGALVGGILLLSASAARAQEKNEIGLVIGAAVTPSRNFSSGSSATVAFDSSLALGAEYDRRLLPGRRASVYGGVDFLAS